MSEGVGKKKNLVRANEKKKATRFEVSDAWRMNSGGKKDKRGSDLAGEAV